MKRLRSLFLALIVLLTSSVTLIQAPVANAQTAGSCSGILSYTHPVTGRGGAVIAQLDVFYKTGYGGTNTACLRHVGSLYGVSTYTFVMIWGPNGNMADGIGHEYSIFAGPVSVYGTKTSCVEVAGIINDPVKGSLKRTMFSVTKVGCGVTPVWTSNYGYY